MQTSNPTQSSQFRLPSRANHVGSLLRSAEIVQARKQFADKEISAEQLRKVEDESITKLVAKEVEVGLKTITDGEYRRHSFFIDFQTGLEGLECLGTVPKKWSKGVFNNKASTITGKIRHTKDIQVDDYKYLHKHVPSSCVGKVCLPSPSLLHSRLGKDNEVYSDAQELFKDVTKAYRAEIDSLYKAGCRFIQFDEVMLSQMCDLSIRASMSSSGMDVESLPEMYIQVINDVIDDRPKDLIISTHHCRGNYCSQWAAQGGYDWVAEVLFGKLNVDAFFLEYDTERAGGFQPLKHVPAGKAIVLGLITSKTGKLEKKEDLIARIHEAAKYCPLEQLAISPQCGFASTEHGNELTEEEQWAKLKLCVEVAKEVWGEN